MKTHEALKKAIEVKGRAILAEERLLTAVLCDLVRADDDMFRLVRHACSDHCFDVLAKCRDEEIPGAAGYALSRMGTYYSQKAIRDMEEMLDFCFPDAGLRIHRSGRTEGPGPSKANDKEQTVYCGKRIDISHVNDVGMLVLYNVCKPGDTLPLSKSFHYTRTDQKQTFMILENGRPLKCRTFSCKDSSAVMVTVAVAVNRDSSIVMRCFAEDHYSDFQSVSFAPSFLDESVIRITAREALEGITGEESGLYQVISGRTGVKVSDMSKYEDLALDLPDLFGSHFYDGQYVCYTYRDISPVLLKIEITLPPDWEKITYKDVEHLFKINRKIAKKGRKVSVKMPYGNDIELELPADLAEGQRIRLSGKGLPGYDGETGDCYLKVSLV